MEQSASERFAREIFVGPAEGSGRRQASRSHGFWFRNYGALALLVLLIGGCGDSNESTSDASVNSSEFADLVHCEFDVQCRNGHVCDQGRCAAKGATCEDDVDCLPFETCSAREGRCTSDCASSQSCQRCAEGECVSDEEYCRDNSECDILHLCEGNVCVPSDSCGETQFDGAFIDHSGRCRGTINQHACSNPFPFDSIEQCEVEGYRRVSDCPDTVDIFRDGPVIAEADFFCAYGRQCCGYKGCSPFYFCDGQEGEITNSCGQLGACLPLQKTVEEACEDAGATVRTFEHGSGDFCHQADDGDATWLSGELESCDCGPGSCFRNGINGEECVPGESALDR